MPNTREKLVELLKEADRYEFETTKKSGVYDSEAGWGYIADSLIANGVTVQGDKDINVPTKWISVKDRLPDCADTVIAVDRCGIMSAAYYVGYWHGGGDLDEYAVTHWMPLPEPPKGE